MQVALRTLPTEALEQLDLVLKAQLASRLLTEQELETAQLPNVAFAAVPMSINSCAEACGPMKMIQRRLGRLESVSALSFRLPAGDACSNG